MSFIKRWDADRITQDLNACYAQVVSAYNDGFTAWACKQDLYRIKFELDQMLANSPEFADEQQWLDQQRIQREQRQMWRTLNKT